MFVIIGIVVVIGSIVGGYLMEHGNIRVLLQPAELLIIGGAAIGTLLVEVLVAFDEKLSDDLSITHRKDASHGEMGPSSQQSPAERRLNLDAANTRRLEQPRRTNRRASACL